ncbi:hypothetical protein [Ligilactobacillus agilis]|uniref:hypothetical protein n=1 Tax=Ligilactobacillus agilis TaxID=1601 RepID=UPI0022E713D6|nr:hypothetical protein [Ligilactobacillus agilis]
MKSKANRDLLRTLGINLAIFISFILLGYFFIYPFIMRGIVFNGDDAWYQVNRLLEVKEGLKAGNPLVYIYSHTFGKVAYPLGIFYPEITIIPISALMLIVKHPVTGIYLGIAGYTILTLVIVYFLLRKLGKSRYGAYIGSVLYAFSAYRTVDAFTRFALGEYIAMTFLPLCLYGFYMILKGNRSEWPYLSMGLAGMLLSHILSTFIVVVFLAICWCASLIYDKKRLKTFLALVKSGIFAILASLMFLEPFLEQEFFQSYSKPSPIPMSEAASTFSDILMSALNNSVLKSYTAAYSIGFPLMLVVFLGAILYKRLANTGKKSYLVGIIILISVSNLFPWYLLQDTIFSVIQYPFRIIMLPTLLLSLVGAEIMDISFENILPKLGKKLIISSILVIGIASFWGSSVQKLIKDPGYNSKNLIYTNNSDYFDGTMYVDQYTPKKTIPYLPELYTHTAIINKKNKIKLSVASKAGEQIFSSHDFRRGITVDVPVSYYKNYEVYQDNKKLASKISKRNTIEVKLRSNNPITIKYRYTVLNKLSYIISVVMWGLFGLILITKNITLKSITNNKNISESNTVF